MGEDKGNEKFFHEMKKKARNPFSVPEDYFEKFPVKLQKRLSSDEKSSFRVWEWILKPQISVPALAVLIVLTLGWSLFHSDHKSDSSELSELRKKDEMLKQQNDLKELVSQMDKQEVTLEHVEPIEEHLVVEEIKESEIITEEIQVESLQEPVAAVEKQEIEYLMDENIDLSLIVEELNMD